MIGVAISTHNRAEFYKTYDFVKQYLPKGAILIVVDDCSKEPIPFSDFRFETNVGAPTAKNKCIELLIERGCEHLFLFDDDCYPVKKGWELPYINSGEKHLCFTWEKSASGIQTGHKLIKRHKGLKQYSTSCGCMMYVHKSVIDTIGGFDVNFPKWGGWHHDFTERAFKSGLISFTHLDVSNSSELFHSMDFFEEIKSSYNGKQKAEFIKQAQNHKKKRGEALFMTYKKKIGVAITTHNRREVFNKTLINIQKHLPKGAELVIVDDCSDVRVPNSYRFNNNVGISVAKNKCIELLLGKGCTELFLFDDDCYPIVDGWHLPYVNSGVKHLSFTWAGRHNCYAVLSEENGIKEYSHPCGCMLYIHKDCIDAVGGFDMNFPLWGNEHVDFSNRVFNYGITSKKYMDVSDSLKLFYAGDLADSNFVSTVARPVKNMLFSEANKRAQKLTGSKAYRSFKTPQNGVILACYFTTIPDPQRNGYWTPKVEDLMVLIHSAQKNGCELRIFNDCFKTKSDNFIRVSPPKDLAPNVSRWNFYREWLKKNPREAVFMVDSTDVEVLKYPFNQIDSNTLYVGDEIGQVTGCKWMKDREVLEPLHLIKDYQKIINPVKNETLLNCGIVGGSYEIVMEFLDKLCPLMNIHNGNMRSNDMATTNYVFWKYFRDRLYNGIKLNTGFKRFETNIISLFKHK